MLSTINILSTIRNDAEPGSLMTLAAEFGDWATRFAATDRHRALAVEAFVDTLACAVLGAPSTQARAVERVMASGRGRSATVLGHDRTPAAAAAVNAAAAHAADFDDNFSPGTSHASAVLVPALIAAAEGEAVRWDRLIPAYVVGLQAQAFVGSIVGYDHYVEGWHGTSTVGMIGTAAAVAYLHSTSAATIGHALTTAVSFAGGTKIQFGTDMKAVHAALAARNAVEAALLAVEGVAGHPEALEGPQGFRALFARGPGTDGDEWLGQVVAVEEPGVLPKRFPSCGSTHLVLDAIDDLRAEHGFTPADVVRVTATIGRAGVGSLPYREPRTGREAKFSMDYCVRTFLRHGTLSLHDFDDERVRRDRQTPGPVVELRAWDADELRLAVGEQPPHRAELLLRDGTVLSRTRELPKGSVQEPFTPAQRRAKFLDCAGVDAASVYERLVEDPYSLPMDAVREVYRYASRTAFS